jgi:hypothetical protein
MSSIEPAGAPAPQAQPVRCPLCDTVVGVEGPRCPSCGLYLGPESGRPNPFTQRVLWLLVGAVLAVYLVTLAGVALLA